jgi:hypothetical protein
MLSEKSLVSHILQHTKPYEFYRTYNTKNVNTFDKSLILCRLMDICRMNNDTEEFASKNFQAILANIV